MMANPKILLTGFLLAAGVVAVLKLYTPSIVEHEIQEIELKWITAKIICPGLEDVESIVLLNPKGYLPFMFLKYDHRLFKHLQNQNKKLVKLRLNTLNNSEKTRYFDSSAISLAGYKIDNARILNINTGQCSLGDIKGHLQS